MKNKMNTKQFKKYQKAFIQSLKKVLEDRGKDSAISEAAFPAYTDANFLARFLFWRRIWVVNKYLENNRPFETILDFGSGSGVLLPIADEYSKHLLGYDINLVPYKEVSKHFNFPPNVRILNHLKNLEEISDNSIDLILCLDVLEHVDDLEGIISKFKFQYKINIR